MRPVDVYKILAVCYHGNYPWMTRLGGGRLEFQTSRMREAFKCYAVSLRRSFYWLEKAGYITDLTIGARHMSLRVVAPQPILDELGYIKIEEAPDVSKPL